MLLSKNIGYDTIEKLNNFVIHAYGHYVVITGRTENNNKYTFLASESILKYILCDMNKKIVLGSLSKLQTASIICTLEKINSEYTLVYYNDTPIIYYKNQTKTLK